MARHVFGDKGAPAIDHGLGHRGRGLTGQRLTRQQLQRLRQHLIVAARAAVETLAAGAVVDCRAQVRGDAGHLLRADRLDPRLFQRLERCARLGRTRHPIGMDAGIVVAQLQRHRVGRAPRNRCVFRVQVAGGVWNPHALARH